MSRLTSDLSRVTYVVNSDTSGRATAGGARTTGSSALTGSTPWASSSCAATPTAEPASRPTARMEMVLVLIALTRCGIEQPPRLWSVPSLAGTLIAALGLFGYPLIAPLIGYSSYHAETFGIHAAPTAVATLGLILIALRGAAMWLAAAVPFLWLILAGLTLTALGAPWANALFATLALGVAGMVWKSATGRDRQGRRGSQSEHQRQRR